MNSVFSFDPIEHIYRLNGEIIPGFSEIMKANGLVDFDDVPPALLERCRKFGANLHKAIHLYNKGTLDAENLDFGLQPGIAAWSSFLDHTGFKPIVAWGEQPICSEISRYGCTPDNILKKDNRYAIAEVKSSSGMRPFMKLQTAAQVKAIKDFYGVKISERFVIQISADGEVKLHEHKDRRDEAFFLSALTVYKFKKENGLWRP